MRKVAALVRASWLEANSYRMRMLFALLSLGAVVVPCFFVARALQPVMQQSIAGEGGNYFTFIIVGMIAFAFLRTSVNALPDEISTSISSGTLEALLGTPTHLATLLAGMVSYAFVWTVIRCAVLVAFAAFMGAHLMWSRALVALPILALIIVTHGAVGMIAAAMILAFRTAGPIAGVAIWVSTVLGGVYYPTQVVPSWLENVSHYVPLAYGLRAMRHTLLDPTFSMSVIVGDVVPLAVTGIVLNAFGLMAFVMALRYARHAGTLAQY